MPDEVQASDERRFLFLKGGEDILATAEGETFNWDAAASHVRDHLAEALNAQHLSFLLGSGASSLVTDGTQRGVPTMAPLAKEFLETIGDAGSELFLTVEERKALKTNLGLDLTSPELLANLERLMEVLLSFEFVLKHTEHDKLKGGKTYVDTAIKKVTKFIQTRCTIGEFTKGDESVLRLYQSFYRKLVYRDRTRTRPWIFTTNYDLFNEIAMDRLGVPYGNGFVGSVERRFNPATYRYSLAEQLDISGSKWSAVSGFVHLCKLHGSVNWIDDGKGFFRVREVLSGEDVSAERVMIYPTPAKQNSSFGSPYVDLFREFQMRVVRAQSVLFVIGYSFGDEHINNLIFQALTIPSFRIVIFAPPNAGGVIQKLRELGDPRIWIVGGDGPEDGTSAHYFNVVVDRFLPHLPGEKVDKAIEKVFENLIAQVSEAGAGSSAGEQ